MQMSFVSQQGRCFSDIGLRTGGQYFNVDADNNATRMSDARCMQRYIAILPVMRPHYLQVDRRSFFLQVDYCMLATFRLIYKLSSSTLATSQPSTFHMSPYGQSRRSTFKIRLLQSTYTKAICRILRSGSYSFYMSTLCTSDGLILHSTCRMKHSIYKILNVVSLLVKTEFRHGFGFDRK